MDDSSGMDELESLQHIDDHVSQKGERELKFVGVQDVMKRPASHEFGDNAQFGRIDANTHEKNDVGVSESDHDG